MCWSSSCRRCVVVSWHTAVVQHDHELKCYLSFVSFNMQCNNCLFCTHDQTAKLFFVTLLLAQQHFCFPSSDTAANVIHQVCVFVAIVVLSFVPLFEHCAIVLPLFAIRLHVFVLCDCVLALF